MLIGLPVQAIRHNAVVCFHELMRVFCHSRTFTFLSCRVGVDFIRNNTPSRAYWPELSKALPHSALRIHLDRHTVTSVHSRPGGGDIVRPRVQGCRETRAIPYVSV